MASILVIGGADTGRAPITAALLRQRLKQQGRSEIVGSAGVLGHDNDPAEVEARDTMTHMGLSIHDHRARSLTTELIADAALLLAIDNGTARVMRARFPESADRTHTLGALAGRQRDIPDPFRMQIGAWITYAREIDSLLEAALPQIVARLTNAQPGSEYSGQPSSPRASSDPLRTAAVVRIGRLLATAADMPDVIDWATARQRLTADFDSIVSTASAGDLVVAYIGLLRAALALTPGSPTPGQLEALQAATAKIAQPVDQLAINELSAQLGGWTSL
jgi:protein-tyrosine-phosphatase